MDRSKLGDLLIEQGHVDVEMRDELLKRQRVEQKRMGQLLVEVANIEAGVLLAALARQHGLPPLDLEAEPPTDAALSLMPPALIRRWETVPLSVDGTTLTVGMVDPRSRLALEETRRATGFTDIQRKVITCTAFLKFAEERLGMASELADAVGKGTSAGLTMSHPSPAGGEEAPPESEDDQPVVALVDYMVTSALERSATDIHLEPFETSSRIRLRIDGALTTLMTVPRRLHAPVVLRLRTLGGAQQTGRRGTIEASVGEQTGRFQLSALPSLHGTKVTLRRLDFEIRTLDDLDLQEDVQKRLAHTLQVAQGLVMVVGPRGSGRTTTALALARAVNDPSRQVALVTQTVDAALPGMIVVPVPQGADMASVVEDALAHDPDVLVVDGAETSETLKVAARAAIEGHLVILTLGGARAVTAIRDLAASGVPAYQVGAALRACVAQRLCRRLDGETAVGHTPGSDELKEFGIPAEAAEKGRFKRPEPATSNHGTGYRGRIAVHEVLFPSPAMRAAIRDGVSTGGVLELARKDGFHTLWEDAILKVVRGDTTFEEVRAALIPPG